MSEVQPNGLKPEGLKEKPKTLGVNPQLRKVEIPSDLQSATTISNDNVSWIDLFKEWLRVWFAGDIIKYHSGETMETQFDVKKFIVGGIVRWLLKIGGGALLGLGITEGSLIEIVGAIVAFVTGIIISWFNSKKLLNTDPAQVKGE